MGTEDGLIPYEGGSSSVFGTEGNDFELMSALESMSTWAHHNGCSTAPPMETAGLDIVQTLILMARQSSMSIQVAQRILLYYCVPTPWMITQGYECATAPNWLINKKCNKEEYWINNNFCEMRCDADGFGYHDSSCCSSSA